MPISKALKYGPCVTRGSQSYMPPTHEPYLKVHFRKMSSVTLILCDLFTSTSNQFIFVPNGTENVSLVKFSQACPKKTL